MRKAIRSTIAALFAVFYLTGCLSGRTEKLVTADMVFRHGTNEVRISQPKDTSFEDLMVSPSDGTIRVKNYRSTANEAAIKSAEEQAKAMQAMFGAARDMARDAIETGLRAYGVPVPQRAPTTIQAPPFQFSPTNTVTK